MCYSLPPHLPKKQAINTKTQVINNEVPRQYVLKLREEHIWWSDNVKKTFFFFFLKWVISASHQEEFCQSSKSCGSASIFSASAQTHTVKYSHASQHFSTHLFTPAPPHPLPSPSPLFAPLKQILIPLTPIKPNLNKSPVSYVLLLTNDADKRPLSVWNTHGRLCKTKWGKMLNNAMEKMVVFLLVHKYCIFKIIITFLVLQW